MSTKPAALPRWASDESNNTEPSSGQKDTGWTPGQDGVSDYDNWIKFLTYQWCEYLSDGAFTGGISVADGLTTDDLTVTDDLTATDLVVTNDLHVQGDTELDGNLQVDGDITLPTGGVVLTVGSVVAVNLRHTGDRTMMVPVCTAIDYQGFELAHTLATTTTGAGTFITGYELGNNNDPLHVPLTLEAGMVVKNVSLAMNKQSPNTSTITWKFCKYNNSTSTETVIATGTYAGNAPGAVEPAMTPFTETISSVYHYYVRITTSGDVASEIMRSLTITYSRP